jgi:hypothetical protein
MKVSSARNAPELRSGNGARLRITSARSAADRFQSRESSSSLGLAGGSGYERSGPGRRWVNRAAGCVLIALGFYALWRA